MPELYFLGVPIGVYLIAFAFAGLVVWYLKSNNTVEAIEMVEDTLDLYDGSLLDEYVTQLFKTLPVPLRETIKDIVEVASPATGKTEIPAKALKILQDMINESEQTLTKDRDAQKL